MSKEFLSERERALENEFFYKRDQQLLENLRQQLQLEQREQELAAAAGIQDRGVLKELAALGISAETLNALSLVPLVYVAWADGQMMDREQQAVMRAASDHGIGEGSPAAELLRVWLKEPPPSSLLDAWKDYLRALGPSLSPEAKQQLERDVLGWAREVAESAGGFLGAGSVVSDAEQQVLTDLERTFQAI